MANVWVGGAAMSGVATECAGRGLAGCAVAVCEFRTNEEVTTVLNGERQKATTGTSLKMFLKRSVDCRIGRGRENIIHLPLRKANFVSRNIGQ